MTNKLNSAEIAQIEDLAITKVKLGQMTEAIDLFREAIQQGSTNFKSRLLLTKILSDIEHSQKAQQNLLQGQASSNLSCDQAA